MRTLAVATFMLACGHAAAEDATYPVRLLTPETALKAAQAALAKCRAEGFQVSVAVVDRSGVVQVMLRDRLASPYSVEIAQRKAQTALNFRMDTAVLDRELQPGHASAGLRSLPYIVTVAGGKVIESAGSFVGGIGVSGAPGGTNDDLCAAAGLRAIADDLEL